MNRTGLSARPSPRALHQAASGLARIDPATARLTRLFCDGRFEARLREVCDLGEWRVEPQRGAESDDLCWVELRYDGGSASIGLDTAQYPALAALAGGGPGKATDADADADAAHGATHDPRSGSRDDARADSHDRARTATAQSGADAAAPLACAIAALLLTPLIDCLESFGALGVTVVSLSRVAPGARRANRRAHGSDGAAATEQAKPARQVQAAQDTRDTQAAQDAQEPDSPALTVRCVCNGQRYECRIGEVEHSWLDLVDTQIALQRLPLRTRVGEIPVPAYLVIGEKQLAIRTLRRLRPGDVVLRVTPAALLALDGAAAADDLELRWGPAGTHLLVARTTLDGRNLVLNTDPTMTYRNDRPEFGTTDADANTSIDELDLPVKFEIETVTLPLMQLSALRAGYVLELPTTLRDARVRLVSYGQLIGIGEMVTVGEQLGVRVIEMFGSHDAN